MKKLMLINASHEEESRVAIVEDDFLQELDIESTHVCGCRISPVGRIWG